MPHSWQAAYRNRKALVTGGAGFIGSNLARRLVELGATVTIVDALIPECGGNLWNVEEIKAKVRLSLTDLRDAETIGALVQGQDYIFNLAGQVSHIDSMVRPIDDLEINCNSHVSLLETCRRHNPETRIVYAGTRQQYGRPRYLPVDENHPQQPTDINGINKMAGESYHLLYHKVHGIRATSLRLTNTFGPRQLIRHARQGFLAVFMRRALEGESIRVFGDGQQLRDLNFVDDVVAAFLMTAADPTPVGQVYNLGSDEVLSLKQIAETMVAVAGRGEVQIVPFPADRKQIDIGSCHCSFEKARQAVGWKPTVRAEEGLRRTLAYYRENAQHYL
jgi:UDP-glucose 4-epimerase